MAIGIFLTFIVPVILIPLVIIETVIIYTSLSRLSPLNIFSVPTPPPKIRESLEKRSGDLYKNEDLNNVKLEWDITTLSRIEIGLLFLRLLVSSVQKVFLGPSAFKDISITAVVGASPEKRALYRSLFNSDESNPFFPATLTTPLWIMLFAHPSFAYKPIGTVHLTQQATYLQKVDWDKTYNITCHLKNCSRVKKGWQFEIHSEVISPESSTVLWKGLGTFLVLAREDTSIPSKEQLHIQQSTITNASSLVKVTPQTPKKYAALSLDYNPIHLSNLAGKVLGVRGQIGHGLFAANYALGKISKEASTVYKSATVSFERVVSIPSELLLGIEGSSYVGVAKGKRVFSGTFSK